MEGLKKYEPALTFPNEWDRKVFESIPKTGVQPSLVRSLLPNLPLGERATER